ncbi:hypothetical protein [Pleurocapsa sp. PCC 7319]|uniref:hypothetical protein n=1 Tax=Pleurocapsa sp. PCC 7319 TaxID=118161 RepID=UPI00034BDBE8|nr:hypothetical protein [Pleurocapsa sp. PCC 7319]
MNEKNNIPNKADPAPPVISTISLSVTDDNATEKGSTPGSFTISRGADTTGDLDVTIELRGLAEISADYTLTPPGTTSSPTNKELLTLTIPDGQYQKHQQYQQYLCKYQQQNLIN